MARQLRPSSVVGTIALGSRRLVGASDTVAGLLRLAALALLLTTALLAPARSAVAAGGGNDDLPYGPDTCVDGYVWREAFPGDTVCVEPWMRDQAAHDNAQAPSRTVVSTLPYGPETCLDGYVWREAVPGDLVCVEPWGRDQASFDNAEAPYRIDPNGAYGPQSCVQGYVWRVVIPEDLVCVEPWVRDQVAFDNADAANRTVASTLPYGPATCLNGYVWREAAPDDLVCVEPWVRDQVAYDNAHAEERKAINAGTNIGVVEQVGEIDDEVIVAEHDSPYVSDIIDFDPSVIVATGGSAANGGTVDYGGSANDNAGQQQTATGPRIWTTTTYWDPAASCWYDAAAGEEVCRSSSVADIPRFQVNGEGFALYGDVTVGVFVPGTDELVARYDVSAGYYVGFDAGSFGTKTALFDCTGRSGVTYEIQAYDWTTDTWSNTLTVTACSSVL